VEEYILAKGELPKRRMKFKGMAIGQWLRVQKKKYLDQVNPMTRGDLSKEQCRRLESLPLWDHLYVD